MPSAIDKRIAARIEQKQIETLLLLEGVAARTDLLVNRAERSALVALLSDDAPGASQEIRAVVPRIKAALEQQFNRLAHWSYQQTTGILAAEIPRRWMRIANPVVVYAGEDQQIEILPGLIADTPTEPVANAGKRMGDNEWRDFCRQYVFPPPSPQKVDEIIHHTVAGQVWTERLDTLSHQIDSFDRLAQTMTTAYSQGASREEIAAQIKPHVRGIASSARRIARTEGLRIATAVQREQYDSLGDMLAGVQIIATLDENTRPHHAARHGTVYWHDRRRRPSIDQLPVLPDEPNCRCFDSPVLKEPAEFKNDPALRAEFANAAGDMIPDPAVYTQWFDRADRGRRMMAVGVKRYQSMERQLGGARPPQWTDFIDGEGKLLGVTALRAETPPQRAARLRDVQAAIAKRAELLGKINRFGFVPSGNDASRSKPKLQRAAPPSTPTPIPPPTPAAAVTLRGRLRPATSIKEAEQIARDLDLAGIVTYKGLGVEVANAINESIADALDLLPSLRSRLKFVGSMQARNRRWIKALADEHVRRLQKQGSRVSGDMRKRIESEYRKAIGRAGKTTYAESLSVGKNDGGVAGIAVNTKFGSDAGRLLKSLQLNEQVGFHPAGTGVIRSVIDHEIGHQMDDELKLSTRPALIDATLAAKLSGRLDPQAVASGLSRYATTNFRELIAEAWAEWKNSSAPRELSRIIGEHVTQQAGGSP